MANTLIKYNSTLLYILLFVLLEQSNIYCQKYKIDDEKMIIFGMYFASGVLQGGREAYHADNDVFEKAFGVGDESFFGSEQWKRQYYSNDPSKGHKPEIFNFSRDYWHMSGMATKTIWIGGSFVIGSSKQKLRHRIYDIVIGASVSSISAFTTYTLLRGLN